MYCGRIYEEYEQEGHEERMRTFETLAEDQPGQLSRQVIWLYDIRKILKDPSLWNTEYLYSLDNKLDPGHKRLPIYTLLSEITSNCLLMAPLDSPRFMELLQILSSLISVQDSIVSENGHEFKKEWLYRHLSTLYAKRFVYSIFTLNYNMAEDCLASFAHNFSLISKPSDFVLWQIPQMAQVCIIKGHYEYLPFLQRIFNQNFAQSIVLSRKKLLKKMEEVKEQSPKLETFFDVFWMKKESIQDSIETHESLPFHTIEYIPVDKKSPQTKSLWDENDPLETYEVDGGTSIISSLDFIPSKSAKHSPTLSELTKIYHMFAHNEH